MNPLAYSNKGKDLWTPAWFVGAIEKEFGIRFVCDMAACRESAVCSSYLTGAEDATQADWGARCAGFGEHGDRYLWCNPPWNNIAPFLAQCVMTRGRAIFCLPNRIEAGWGHWLESADLVHVAPRVSYIDPETGMVKGSPNVGTVLAFLDPMRKSVPTWRRWEVRKP